MRLKMKPRTNKFRDESPTDSLVLRERLGLKRYRKMAKRDPEKRDVLIRLAMKKMEESEQGDFIVLGYRRRRVVIDRD
jgi:hypothetical protein